MGTWIYILSILGALLLAFGALFSWCLWNKCKVARANKKAKAIKYLGSHVEKTELMETEKAEDEGTEMTSITSSPGDASMVTGCTTLNATAMDITQPNNAPQEIHINNVQNKHARAISERDLYLREAQLASSESARDYSIARVHVLNDEIFEQEAYMKRLNNPGCMSQSTGGDLNKQVHVAIDMQGRPQQNQIFQVPPPLLIGAGGLLEATMMRGNEFYQMPPNGQQRHPDQNMNGPPTGSGNPNSAFERHFPTAGGPMPPQSPQNIHGMADWNHNMMLARGFDPRMFPPGMDPNVAQQIMMNHMRAQQMMAAGVAPEGMDPRMIRPEEDPRMALQGVDPRMARQSVDPRMTQQLSDPRMAQQGGDPTMAQLNADPRMSQQVADPRMAQQGADPRTTQPGTVPRIDHQSTDPRKSQQGVDPRMFQHVMAPGMIYSNGNLSVEDVIQNRIPFTSSPLQEQLSENVMVTQQASNPGVAQKVQAPMKPRKDSKSGKRSKESRVANKTVEIEQVGESDGINISQISDISKGLDKIRALCAEDFREQVGSPISVRGKVSPNTSQLAEIREIQEEYANVAASLNESRISTKVHAKKLNTTSSLDKSMNTTSAQKKMNGITAQVERVNTPSSQDNSMNPISAQKVNAPSSKDESMTPTSTPEKINGIKGQVERGSAISSQDTSMNPTFSQEKVKAASSVQSVGSTDLEEGSDTSTSSESSSEDEYEVNPTGSLEDNGRQVLRSLRSGLEQMREDWTIEEGKEETL